MKRQPYPVAKVVKIKRQGNLPQTGRQQIKVVSGDGLWKASGNIAVLDVGQEQSVEVGYKHDNMLAGNHTGTWAVKDSTGKILDQKKYTVVLEAAK